MRTLCLHGQGLRNPTGSLSLNVRGVDLDGETGLDTDLAPFTVQLRTDLVDGRVNAETEVRQPRPVARLNADALLDLGGLDMAEDGL